MATDVGKSPFWELAFATHLFIIPQDWVGLLLRLLGSLL